MANEYGDYHDSGNNDDTDWAIRTAVLRVAPGTIRGYSSPNTPSWVPEGWHWNAGLYVHANSAHTNVGILGMAIHPTAGYVRVIHDDTDPAMPGIGSVIAHGDESFALKGVLVGPSGGNGHSNLYFYRIGKGPINMASQRGYNLVAGRSMNIWYAHFRPRVRGIGGAGLRSRVSALENVSVAGSGSNDQLYNVKKFSAVGDGVTNDTVAVQAAITAALATGGTVWFPPGHYVVQPGALSYGYNESTVTPMPPIKFKGAGADWRTTVGAGGVPTGGSRLDFQGTPLGRGVGCIELFGTGLFEMEGMFITQTGTAHTIPYVYSTNTTLMISRNVFQGHSSKGSTTCNQDAIVMGAVLPPDAIVSTENSRFQGYGTVIRENAFHRVRRAVWGRRATNAVVVRDNTVWSTCGSDGGSLANSGAAIEFQGVSTSYTVGVTIEGNLIETNGYYAGIRLGDYTANCSVIANNMYDPGAQTVVNVHLTALSNAHVLIAGYHYDGQPFVQYDGAAGSASRSTVVNAHQGQQSSYPQPTVFTYSSGFTVQSNSAVSAAQIRSGVNSPEGAVAANPGSLWLRANGTNDATLYVKATGTGATGWRAVTTAAP